MPLNLFKEDIDGKKLEKLLPDVKLQDFKTWTEAKWWKDAVLKIESNGVVGQFKYNGHLCFIQDNGQILEKHGGCFACIRQTGLQSLKMDKTKAMVHLIWSDYIKPYNGEALYHWPLLNWALGPESPWTYLHKQCIITKDPFTIIVPNTVLKKYGGANIVNMLVAARQGHEDGRRNRIIRFWVDKFIKRKVPQPFELAIVAQQLFVPNPATPLLQKENYSDRLFHSVFAYFPIRSTGDGHFYFNIQYAHWDSWFTHTPKLDEENWIKHKNYMSMTIDGRQQSGMNIQWAGDKRNNPDQCLKLWLDTLRDNGLVITHKPVKNLINSVGYEVHGYQEIPHTPDEIADILTKAYFNTFNPTAKKMRASAKTLVKKVAEKVRRPRIKKVA